jgi:carbonic anhydrase
MKKLFLNVAMGLLVLALFSCRNQNAPTENKEGASQAQAPDESSLDPMAKLKAGNQRFSTGKAVHLHQDSAKVKELVGGQKPFVVVVSCSDSRVPPEEIFDQGLGDIFTIRTAGNVMSDYEIGSIEYAVEHLGTKLIVVMGHESCGAVSAFLEHEKDDNVPGHIKSIIAALKSEPELQDTLKTRDNLLPRAVRANVRHDVKQLQTSEPILQELYKKGEITVVGAVYHLNTGQVEFL